MRIDAKWMQDASLQQVFKMLHTEQACVYYVGGCVRNAILNAGPTDIDLATDALPETVLKIAEKNGLRAIPTGIAHGTVSVLVKDRTIEITTFRKDVATDGRRAVVTFSKSIEEDALRRDFTMNALYADVDGQIYDPLDGLKDTLARKIRFIADPDQRIKEDYLRILRFFRLHAYYGDLDDGLDPEALDACTRHLEGLGTLSKERIGQEICKLLAAPNPAQSIAAMMHCGVLAQILPGADTTALAPLIHLESQIDAKPKWLRRLAALGGENIKDKLRLSNYDTRDLSHIQSVLSESVSPKILGYRLGKDLGLDALLVLHAKLGTQLPDTWQTDLAEGAGAEFPVTAADLSNRYTGKALGDCLKRLENAWIASDLRLTKTALLDTEYPDDP